MAEHKPMPVAGYTSQSEERVATVNINKQIEEQVLRRLDELKDRADIDQRWLAIGRTGVEKSFMAINRAVFQPQRAKLDGDAS
jgi:hypothetical protein